MVDSGPCCWLLGPSAASMGCWLLVKRESELTIRCICVESRGTSEGSVGEGGNRASAVREEDAHGRVRRRPLIGCGSTLDGKRPGKDEVERLKLTLFFFQMEYNRMECLYSFHSGEIY